MTLELNKNKKNDKKKAYKLYGKSNYDEYWTPNNAVIPILKFIDKNKIIWCPFDTKESNFVKILKSNGFKVVYSHIENGQDFFKYEPKEWDLIISNPPYSLKKEIFERCINFNKPFALIMSVGWLNTITPLRLYDKHELQILFIDKRVNYLDKIKNVINRPTFSSAYFCKDFLPKQIVITKLIGNNKSLNDFTNK